MFISVTKFRVKSIFSFLPFFRYSARSLKQAQLASGILHVETKPLSPFIFCTLTAWESKKHMYRYISSGAHAEAMKAAGKLASGLYSTHFECDYIPNWKEALQRLKDDPEASKKTKYLRQEKSNKFEVSYL